MSNIDNVHRAIDAARAPSSINDRAVEWLRSGDTGVSSETLFDVFMGRAPIGGKWGPRMPADPSDFGRCHRLLLVMPEWRARLTEVPALLPEWGPMVREWSRMEALYETALASKTGRAHELYDLMRKLEVEGYGETP